LPKPSFHELARQSVGVAMASNYPLPVEVIRSPVDVLYVEAVGKTDNHTISVLYGYVGSICKLSIIGGFEVKISDIIYPE
jgi:hypothetical protein